jgi:hypothetical protein
MTVVVKRTVINDLAGLARRVAALMGGKEVD